jgi:hypothetical protein
MIGTPFDGGGGGGGGGPCAHIAAGIKIREVSTIELSLLMLQFSSGPVTLPGKSANLMPTANDFVMCEISFAGAGKFFNIMSSEAMVYL